MSELTTDDAINTNFPPHGQITIANYDNDIVVYRARGPFNEEIIQALEEIEAELLTKMNQLNEHWVEVIKFEHSCLTSLDALVLLEATLVKLKQEGKTPSASAFVFPPELEGVSTMKSLYRSVFQKVGIEFHSFEQFSDALSWAKNKLKALKSNL